MEKEQEKGLAIARVIVVAVDEAFESHGYIPHRCLAASTVSAEILRENGWKVEPFPCSADAVSRLLLDLLEQNAGKPIEPAVMAEWVKQGARMVSVGQEHQPVQDLHKWPLNGHYCLVAKRGQTSVFVDAALRQFQRNTKEHGWHLAVENVLVEKIPNELFNYVKSLNAKSRFDVGSISQDEKPKCTFHTTDGNALIYRYERLKAIEKLTKRPNSKEFKASDLNIKKHEAVIRTARTLLK